MVIIAFFFFSVASAACSLASASFFCAAACSCAACAACPRLLVAVSPILAVLARSSSVLLLIWSRMSACCLAEVRVGQPGFGADAFQSAGSALLRRSLSASIAVAPPHLACQMPSILLEAGARQLDRATPLSVSCCFSAAHSSGDEIFRRQCFKACTGRGGRIQTGIHRLLHRIGVVAHRFLDFARTPVKTSSRSTPIITKSIL